MIRCLIIALLIGAVGCSQFRRNKREMTTKCPSCVKNISDCAPKYQIPKDHTACLKYKPEAKPFPLTQEEKNQIVQQHNDIRSNVTPPAADMLQMLWDDELEMIATHWAYQCKRDANNPLIHDHVRFIPVKNYDQLHVGRTSVGQNLALGQKTFAIAIAAWAWENFWYKFSFGKPVNKVNNIGHYTQIVWSTTNRIGCGRVKCPIGGSYYVCNYAPAGNTIPFSSPYEKAEKERGSSCKTKTKQGLCDCGTRFCGYNYLFVNNCSCSCSPGPECDLDCNSGKDHSYCNSVPGYFEKDCETQWYMPQSCPRLCGFCPCSGVGYKPKMCDVTSSSTKEPAEINIFYTGIILVFSWIESLL